MSIFSTKQLYEEVCYNSSFIRKMSDEELKCLQSHLRKMYLDIETVCKKNGLRIMIGGGNLLGAMRHGGFIPWDDDMDLYMPREDYDLFVKKFAAELPDYYECYAPESECGPLIGFCKIVDKRTKFVGPGGEKRTYGHGVFIDIMPLENIAPGNIFNGIRRIGVLGCIYIGGCVYQYQYSGEIYRKLMNGSLQARVNYWLRHIVGAVCSIVKYETWMKWENKLCQYKKRTGYYIRPMGNYDWTPLPESIYLPIHRAKYDDIEVNIVNDPIRFLELNYEDWQSIPKPNKRWRHFIIEMHLEGFGEQ